MRKLIWTLVILVIVGVFGGRAWYLYQNREIRDNVVKIGVLLPLSGPVARDGQDCLTGIKAAEQNINQNPSNHFKIKLMIEDTKYTEKYYRCENEGDDGLSTGYFLPIRYDYRHNNYWRFYIFTSITSQNTYIFITINSSKFVQFLVT